MSGEQPVPENEAQSLEEEAAALEASILARLAKAKQPIDAQPEGRTLQAVEGDNPRLNVNLPDEPATQVITTPAQPTTAEEPVQTAEQTPEEIHLDFRKRLVAATQTRDPKQIEALFDEWEEASEDLPETLVLDFNRTIQDSLVSLATPVELAAVHYDLRDSIVKWGEFNQSDWGYNELIARIAASPLPDEAKSRLRDMLVTTSDLVDVKEKERKASGEPEQSKQGEQEPEAAKDRVAIAAEFRRRADEAFMAGDLAVLEALINENDGELPPRDQDVVDLYIRRSITNLAIGPGLVSEFEQISGVRTAIDMWIGGAIEGDDEKTEESFHDRIKALQLPPDAEESLLEELKLAAYIRDHDRGDADDIPDQDIEPEVEPEGPVVTQEEREALLAPLTPQPAEQAPQAEPESPNHEDSPEIAEIKESGQFSEVRHVGSGSSGEVYYVVDKVTGAQELLKLSANKDQARSLLAEADVVIPGRRDELDGLQTLSGYPLAEVPNGVTLEPTIRGLSENSLNRGYWVGIPGMETGLLLEWIEEAESGQPGYRRLDKLIQEKSGEWTDLEILNIIAPFAYLLSKMHPQGVVYNDVGADKAEHFYFDESKNQLKVIDWANTQFTKDAGYNKGRLPLHDVRGLARLIYHMRTGEDPAKIEQGLSAQDIQALLAARHIELGTLLQVCLDNAATPLVKDGEHLYKIIEGTILRLREAEEDADKEKDKAEDLLKLEGKDEDVKFAEDILREIPTADFDRLVELDKELSKMPEDLQEKVTAVWEKRLQELDSV